MEGRKALVVLRRARTFVWKIWASCSGLRRGYVSVGIGSIQ